MGSERLRQVWIGLDSVESLEKCIDMFQNQSTEILLTIQEHDQNMHIHHQPLREV
jgi:hypothetical protein